jgi:hypothetical protein
MTFANTRQNMGLLPFRDHRDDVDLDWRRCLWGLRFDKFESDSTEKYSDADGDFNTFSYWACADDDPDGQRTGKFGSVFAAWPAAVTTQKPKNTGEEEELLPLRNWELEHDERYKGAELQDAEERFPLTPDPPRNQGAQPKGEKKPEDEAKYSSTFLPRTPGGVTGIAIAGTEERDQQVLFMGAWEGLLVTDQASKNPGEYSTRVMGMRRGESDLDPDLVAGLHGYWDVKGLPGVVASGHDFGGRAGITWLLKASEADGQTGMGLYLAAGDGAPAPNHGGGTVIRNNTPPPTGDVIGAASYEVGGPWHPGALADQHALGSGSAQGSTPMNAGHIHILALFYGDATLDAPLDFKKKFEPPGAVDTVSGSPKRVKLEFDPTVQHTWAGGGAQGLWRWHVMDAIEEDPVDIGPGPGGFGRLGASTACEKAFGTPFELRVPGFTFSPTPVVNSHRDLHDTRRALHGRYDAAMRKRWVRRPEAVRVEAWGNERGAGEYVETKNKTKRRSCDRETTGGGLAIFPPQVGLEDYLTDYAPQGVTKTTTYLALLRDDVCLAIGRPDPTTGGVTDGFVWANDGDDSVWKSVDGSGTATERMRVTSAGLLSMTKLRVPLSAEATVGALSYVDSHLQVYDGSSQAPVPRMNSAETIAGGWVFSSKDTALPRVVALEAAETTTSSTSYATVKTHSFAAGALNVDGAQVRIKCVVASGISAGHDFRITLGGTTLAEVTSVASSTTQLFEVTIQPWTTGASASTKGFGTVTNITSAGNAPDSLALKSGNIDLTGALDLDFDLKKNGSFDPTFKSVSIDVVTATA